MPGRSGKARAEIAPNDRGLIRLATSVVIEQNNEWLVCHRYLSNHSREAILSDLDNDNRKEEARELDLRETACDVGAALFCPALEGDSRLTYCCTSAEPGEARSTQCGQTLLRWSSV
jgi:hypothetical protein